jgi:hypothetical protein
MSAVIESGKKIFTQKLYLPIFLVLCGILYSSLVFLPGKNIKFFNIFDYSLIFILSVLTVYSLIIHSFLFFKQKSLKSAVLVLGQGGMGSISGIIASAFTTATCAACLSGILGFLGVGTLYFLLDNRLLITLTTIILLLVSIYFASQKVLGICKVCRI